uniref:LPS export ABC transporter permease LptG n=1 Tax=Candidatus Aschnera chinzeii TaxID=1485666 RepID=A0AAT9G4B8_9ENTR|nr:MAG: LPS export ABC transporter permease LptG [Candidatus Aschnera chinzeii]
MLTILEKYISKNIIYSIITTFGILLSLSGIIKFVEQLKKIGDLHDNIWNIFIFTLLIIPRDIDIFFPMASMLGTLFGLGQLASHSELIIIQAIGYSRLQIILMIMKIAIPLVILITFMGELIIPLTEKLAFTYKIERINNKSLMKINNSLWFKESEKFIYIKNVISKNKMNNISIFELNMEKKLKSIIFADYAIYDINNQMWQLFNVYKTMINKTSNINTVYYKYKFWKSNLNPEKLQIISIEPNILTIYGLYKYVNFLGANGQDNLIYKLNLWKKIFSPISGLIMIIMALSFIFGPLRTVPMGVRILTGIFIGFIFYLLTHSIADISILYGFHPLTAILISNIIFFIFSICMIIYQIK